MRYVYKNKIQSKKLKENNQIKENIKNKILKKKIVYWIMMN